MSEKKWLPVCPECFVLREFSVSSRIVSIARPCMYCKKVTYCEAEGYIQEVKFSGNSRFCDCKDWKAGIGEMDSIFMLAFTHGVNYKGKLFVYCPWCGSTLREGK